MTPRAICVLALGVFVFGAAVVAAISRVWLAVPFMLGLAIFCLFSAALCSELEGTGGWFDRRLW